MDLICILIIGFLLGIFLPAETQLQCRSACRSFVKFCAEKISQIIDFLTE